MSITVTDPALLAELLRTDGHVELTDPRGAVIGTFSIEGRGKLPPGKKSPFTAEELAERRKCQTGRPLADILRDLEKRR